MKIIISLLFIILFAFVGFGQDKRFKVSVKVVSQTDITAQIQSYVERELRSLGDVDVDSGKLGQFTIYITITKTRTESGFENGYAIATATTELQPCGAGICDDLLFLNLYTSSPDHIKSAAQEIGTDFDTGVLAKRRKTQ